MRIITPPLGAAVTGTVDLPPCPGNAKVTSVEFVPDASWTGQATNFRRFRLLNQSRAGQVVAQLDVTAGAQNLGTAVAIPLVGAPAVREADQLRWSSEAVGTGQADPGGMVFVVATRYGGGTF